MSSWSWFYSCRAGLNRAILSAPTLIWSPLGLLQSPQGTWLCWAYEAPNLPVLSSSSQVLEVE